MTRFTVLTVIASAIVAWQPAVQGQETAPSEGFRFQAESEKSLGLWDGGRPVLVYNHGNVMPPGSAAGRGRACYFHPVYGLDGEVLTDDFPRDHTYHRGMYFAWPHIKIGDTEYELWTARGELKQVFRRFTRQDARRDSAELGIENEWVAGNRPLVREQIDLRVARATGETRTIDVRATWTPLVQPLTLSGAEGKSYGGFNFRFASRTKPSITVPAGAELPEGATATEGRASGDLLMTRLPWADFTGDFSGSQKPSGAAIFVHPRHPDYPPTWMARHYGLMSVGWPGVQPQTFPTGKSITCEYRILIHRGSASAGQIEKAYGEWRASELPAFPGAEGFGAASKGGRGGRVIKVTNLKSAGPGSLAAACAEAGPRTVVFDVSGVIEGDVVIEHGQISILGQTAPGAGITISGSLKTRYRAREPIDDVIIRFLRVRPPAASGAGGDAVQLSENKRVIVDHVSCSWATDETIDIYGAQDVTIQWCTLEESATEGHPKGRHNFGLISGPEGKRVSLHHNLFAHHSRRCPAIANGPADVRNNVIYDFRDGFGHENEPNDQGYNVVGNYFKRGPSSQKIFPFCFRDRVTYHLRDNFIEGIGTVQDPWAEADKLEGLRYYAGKGRKADAEVPVPKVTTHAPAVAYELVLAGAGCLPLDAVTRRIIGQVRAATGSWGRKPHEDLMEGLTAQSPPADRDGDGMPDAWESARGLDPQVGSDHAEIMASGYTAIEEYSHATAEHLIAAGQARR